MYWIARLGLLTAVLTLCIGLTARAVVGRASDCRALSASREIPIMPAVPAPMHTTWDLDCSDTDCDISNADNPNARAKCRMTRASAIFHRGIPLVSFSWACACAAERGPLVPLCEVVIVDVNRPGGGFDEEPICEQLLCPLPCNKMESSERVLMKLRITVICECIL